MKAVLKKYSKIKAVSYGAAKVKEYFGKDGRAFSLAFSEYDGRFPEKNYIVNHKCNETYFVIEGNFEIGVRGDKVYKLEKSDSLFVPKGLLYSVKGKGKLIAINDPPWNEEQFEEGAK